MLTRHFADPFGSQRPYKDFTVERLSFWTKQAETKVQAGNRQATGRLGPRYRQATKYRQATEVQAGNRQGGRQAGYEIQVPRLLGVADFWSP